MAHKPSICTMSLGRCFAGHSLERKLDMARKYGFQGIELFYEDLVDLAATMPGGDTPGNQLAAAAAVRQLCEDRELAIICLQPFMHYEGLVDRTLHSRRLEDMRLWIRLAHALGVDLILLPSTNLPPAQTTDNMDTVVSDMAEMADLGLASTPVIRFAYEALCWGTRVDTWEASWDVVQRVNRPNFGICLDTFNIAGRIYADPAAPSGRTQNCDEAVAASLSGLVSSVDLRKVFLLQIADAERLARPLDSSHAFYNAEQPPRMSWSRNARLFYGESSLGGYLPAKPILNAIVHGLGYTGWLSFEVFNRALTDTGAGVPETMARRAAQSWRRMVSDLALRTDESSFERRQAML
ncbi:3-dehydroshikimate dehydratase [Tolypocladium paradoxum]|uniref:3-dehydroshikimate dehydratase n=1 Tax=Tolypocladium paradoxum TaxID=94208 RepID=A0A2S4KZ88_9HYPO|nr:3-dehydroshikimate dehydratase [Tolypocladium paradoxum]